MTRPLVMGVLNVTPDSFSDGGLWLDPDAAVAHARELADSGADIIDVGGESTRPGAGRVALEDELHRTLPVIEALARAGLTVSVDTMRAEVARRAVAAGAAYINDVSGGLADPDMASVAAEAAGSGCDVIVMHWRGHSADMQQRAVYGDVTADVIAELSDRVGAFTAAGVPAERIILDPGLGFAKSFEHNWRLIATLPTLMALGHRVIVGTSRKGFLGAVGRPEGHPRPPRERDVATAVTSAYLSDFGVWGVRVHDVPSTVDALDVAQALRAAREASAATPARRAED
ncbi:dihydropteroate synthase [Nostocoides sp. F2B08]|uniref:dihydropteroate synthase n=1 Tax=Nostocoides sp. F2B08 TaxID=2653936 RepID=UPI0012636EA7|nr:dihydropteroate synthase [Tetrasphaera sp. F2B08]KAB7746496.1 dihydropteroate synthase [Tetrasphaera sp. F2B08]